MNGIFDATGCVENICQPPGSALTGYVFTDPTCVVVPRCGTIACDRGFEGTPVVVCPSNGGTFTATGCSRMYYLSSCPPDFPIPVTSPPPQHFNTEPNHSLSLSLSSAVGCPVNSNGTLCACNSGYTGTPNFNTTTGAWDHVCTAAPCPSFANTPGACVCNSDYTRTLTWTGTAWAGTCDCTALVDTNTQANFCTQQKAQGACTDPGLLGVCQRTCCTGTENLPPTFTYTSGSTTSGPLTFPVSTTGTFSRSAALTNISPVESTQTIVTTNGVVQCSVPSGSNLAGATLRIVGGVGELSFTGPVGSATTGTISCPITDNGSPALTTTAIFPITVGTPVTPFPGWTATPVTDLPCDGVCLFGGDIPQVNGDYRVSVLTGAVVSGKALLTNLHGGITGEAATVTCSPQTGTASNVFTVLPQVTRTTGDVGLLSFTAGQIVTDVLVTCTAVDSANLQTAFRFVISIGKETDDKIMRLGLVGIVSAFNKALFVQLVQGYLNGLVTTRLAGQIRDVVIYFVCPASACGTTLLTCPVTSTLKIAAGCVRGDDIANARGAALLADANSVVDFTITTANVDGTAAKIAEVETAQTALNGCIDAYLRLGTACSVSGIGPSDTVTLVEKPQQAPTALPTATPTTAPTAEPTTEAPSSAAMTWCTSDAQCKQHGDTAATCKDNGHCTCGDGFVKPFDAASGRRAHICVSSETRVSDVVHAAFDVACDGSSGKGARVGELVVDLVGGTVTDVREECGSLNVFVSVSDMLLLDVAAMDVAARLSEKVQASDLGLGNVLSAGLASVDALQCPTVPGVSQVFRTDAGECVPLSCLSGYTRVSTGTVYVCISVTAAPVEEPTDSDDELAVGAIVGISVGVGLFVIAAVVLVVCYVARKQPIVENVAPAPKNGVPPNAPYATSDVAV